MFSGIQYNINRTWVQIVNIYRSSSIEAWSGRTKSVLQIGTFDANLDPDLELVRILVRILIRNLIRIDIYILMPLQIWIRILT